MSKNTLIKIYATTWCGDCRRAKAWLTEHKVPFEEINIEQDEKAVEYVQEVNKGMHSVPTMVFPDGSTLTEPSNAELEERVKSLHLFPNEKNKIIFVFNANSSLFAQITDYAHKVISPDTYQCNLCKLTYGNLGMEQKWKEFIQTIPYTVQFFHKDELIRQNQQFANTDFPAVFISINDTIKQVITAQEINTKQTLVELKMLVTQKIKDK